METNTLHDLYAYSGEVNQSIHRIETLLKAPGRVLIGLSGGPGSGKSTLADYLQFRLDKIAPDQVVCLPMDGFHFSKSHLSTLSNSEEAFSRRGAPWTFDVQSLYRHLKNIRSNYQKSDAHWPGFDHTSGDPIVDSQVIPKEAKVILIEGLYLLYDGDSDWKEIAYLFNEHWFLDTPLELALERLAQRHMQAWGYTYPQAIKRIQQSDVLNAQLVANTKRRADWSLAL